MMVLVVKRCCSDACALHASFSKYKIKIETHASNNKGRWAYSMKSFATSIPD